MQQLAEFASNNPWLVSGLIASALAVIFNEIRLRSAGVSALSTAMTIKIVNDGGAIVDLRSADQFAAAHIAESHNISEPDLRTDTSLLDKFKKNIVLVCDNGGRSSAFANRLRKDGLERVFSLKGGLHAWQQENLPLTGDGKPGS